MSAALSEPQQRVIDVLARWQRDEQVAWEELERFSRNPYSTMDSLVRRGLVEEEWSPWDHTMLYTITDAGRALASTQEGSTDD